jgi:hypothetical protein
MHNADNQNNKNIIPWIKLWTLLRNEVIQNSYEIQNISLLS